MSPRVLNPKISAEFEAVILRCLEKDPDDRFQRHSDLIDALLPPTEPMFPAARPASTPEAPRSWLWPAAAAAGMTLFAIILLAIYSAEAFPPMPEVRSAPNPEPPPAPVALLPRETPPKEEPPAPKPPENKPELKPLPPKPKEEKKAPPDPAAGAAETLKAFRAALASAEDAELIGETPWGTWRRDLHEAPGGDARYDPGTKTCVLTARGDLERAWIKKPFAGAKAGYQVRFRLRSAESPRLALAIALTRWIEFRGSGAEMYLLRSDDSIVQKGQVAFEPPISEGSVSVIPRASHTLIFLDDRLLFTIPDAECPHWEGIRLGAGGGTVVIDSVLVKDRSR